MSALDDRIAELQAHRTHCVEEMERTAVESSPMVANAAAWREEIRTIDHVIAALNDLRTAINAIIAYLTEADKKLKFGGLPEEL